MRKISVIAMGMVVLGLAACSQPDPVGPGSDLEGKPNELATAASTSSETWCLEQKNGSGDVEYRGNLTIAIDPYGNVSGNMNWFLHSDATVTGYPAPFPPGSFVFNFHYSSNFYGRYGQNVGSVESNYMGGYTQAVVSGTPTGPLYEWDAYFGACD